MTTEISVMHGSEKVKLFIRLLITINVTICLNFFPIKMPIYNHPYEIKVIDALNLYFILTIGNSTIFFCVLCFKHHKFCFSLIK